MKTAKKKLNPNARKWVKALRSGKYKQAKEALCRIEDGKPSFCCLGVACDLFVKSGEALSVEDHPSLQLRSFGGQRSSLPARVRLWLGLDHGEGAFTSEKRGTEFLSSINDNGAPFAEIADLIESQPEGLFV